MPTSTRGYGALQFGPSSASRHLDAEHTAVRVDRGSDVKVEVSVDPAGDLGVILYDGHGHPFR